MLFLPKSAADWPQWIKDNSTETESGCWEWNGSRVPLRGNYGRIWIVDGHVLAHRFSYEAHNGPFDAELVVMHKCDNPPCVNPSHLVLGTYQDNAHDMIKKSRRVQPKSRWVRDASSLDEDKVRAIRKCKADGWTYASICRHFKTPRSTIRAIFEGRSWKYVV